MTVPLIVLGGKVDERAFRCGELLHRSQVPKALAVAIPGVVAAATAIVLVSALMLSARGPGRLQPFTCLRESHGSVRLPRGRDREARVELAAEFLVLFR